MMEEGSQRGTAGLGSFVWAGELRQGHGVALPCPAPGASVGAAAGRRKRGGGKRADGLRHEPLRREPRCIMSACMHRANGFRGHMTVRAAWQAVRCQRLRRRAGASRCLELRIAPIGQQTPAARPRRTKYSTPDAGAAPPCQGSLPSALHLPSHARLPPSRRFPLR